MTDAEARIAMERASALRQTTPVIVHDALSARRVKINKMDVKTRGALLRQTTMGNNKSRIWSDIGFVHFVVAHGHMAADDVEDFWAVPRVVLVPLIRD